MNQDFSISSYIDGIPYGFFNRVALKEVSYCCVINYNISSQQVLADLYLEGRKFSYFYQNSNSRFTIQTNHLVSESEFPIKFKCNGVGERFVYDL